jgi:hypothetical protein
MLGPEAAKTLVRMQEWKTAMLRVHSREPMMGPDSTMGVSKRHRSKMDTVDMDTTKGVVRMVIPSEVRWIWEE